jgi:hypothetical protein
MIVSAMLNLMLNFQARALPWRNCLCWPVFSKTVNVSIGPLGPAGRVFLADVVAACRGCDVRQIPGQIDHARRWRDAADHVPDM